MTVNELAYQVTFSPLFWVALFAMCAFIADRKTKAAARKDDDQNQTRQGKVWR